MDDEFQRFLKLRQMVSDPMLSVCGKTVVDGIRRKMQSLASNPRARTELVAEREFRRSMWLLAEMRSLSDYAAASASLTDLARRAADTEYGRLASRMEGAIATAYAKSEEATRRARETAARNAPVRKPPATLAPNFPTSSGRSVPVPVREGNRVTFQPAGR
jgi:hypothetical protein